MDDRRFDALARALGGASTRRGALGALAGIVLLAGGIPADAAGKGRNDDARAAARNRRPRRCRPACPPGQTCRQGACACTNGGAVCGAACCTAAQRCEAGACMTPPAPCIAQGEACGNGTPCCDGLQCGSGYGGGPVACWPVPGGTCEVNEDCSYGQHCENGECVYDPPPPPPPPPCQPTFPVTSAAGANGKALQDAVAAAADGDTIVLGPGDYRFDHVVYGTQSALVIDSKALTIERCQPDAVVNLLCPQSLDADYANYCVEVFGFSAPGSLTLTGVNVSAEFSRLSTIIISSALRAPGSVVLQDVLLENAKADGTGGGITASTPVTVKDGVTIRVKNGQGAGGWYALYTNNPGVITCETPPTFEGYTIPCPSFANTVGCGC